MTPPLSIEKSVVHNKRRPKKRGKGSKSQRRRRTREQENRRISGDVLIPSLNDGEMPLEPSTSELNGSWIEDKRKPCSSPANNDYDLDPSSDEDLPPPVAPEPKKTGPPAAAAKPSQPNFKPEVVIKEELIDIDEPPVPSTSRTDPESILPCTESFQSGIPVLPCEDPVLFTSGTDHDSISSCTDSFQSGTTPTLGEVLTVIKTEPEDDEPQTNLNGNSGKATKRKAAEMADVGQSESPSNEDSVIKNDNAKDHVFQCTIRAAYTLVNSGPVVGEQQVVQEPQWFKTSNSTKTQSSQNKTFAEQSLPVAEDSSITENKSAQSHLDDYGKYIAGELKMLDSKSCAHVQRVIADLLFDAKLGKFK